ncbi:NADH:flavin oxidoreductase [Noviherbaspirillum sedimenti]|uniref:12-oxophytodienoate reductase n=1 Tax=Noviherbaspirillum sedimenti TaxID=2320865 RepID=A0A3A3FYS4_9BURK|nr:NADH:flavin oxidoreductase [Noviherbaspirillum sedimenti]RJG01358.1 12-oxophytodienoate reductase [Noviherbaspirillum sedimenti]
MSKTSYGTLFDPVDIGGLHLKNRIVMAPMTRGFSPDGVPGEDVANYYRRRAESGVGLIVTEGTWVPHPGASNEENVPRFYGRDALDGWANVVSEVHAGGGRIVPQLWHVGLITKSKIEGLYEKGSGHTDLQVGPSGLGGGMGEMPSPINDPMSQRQIDDVIDAFATAAETACRLGFDGVAFHGAHGYLIDQFFWEGTNQRLDKYGGTIAQRTRFACEIVEESRRRTRPDFPLMFRFSQWKLQDYAARLCNTPQELEEFLTPLVNAGVDIFDCSQRRFWEPEFPGSDLNLAGWVKKITGKTVMTVGSVGLDLDVMPTLMGESSKPESLDRLIEMLERGDFDLVGVGRALLVDPAWPKKIRAGMHGELMSYHPDALLSLS